MAAMEGTGRHPSLPAGTQTPTRCRSAPSRGVGDDKHASATRLTGAAASVLVEEPVGDVAEAVTVDGDRLAGAEVVAYDEHDHWKLLFNVRHCRSHVASALAGWRETALGLPGARSARWPAGSRRRRRRRSKKRSSDASLQVHGADRCRRGARARGAVALAAVDHLDVEERQSLPEHGYARRKSLRLSVRVKARVWL
jgi:hypothetical protein